tara:strand:+ start:1214 stop:1378 length:165 start_codon:yes stop_codon:yes gene_type:complete
MDDEIEHICNKCKKDCELLYGLKPYEMKDHEFYCKPCFKVVHGIMYDDVGDVNE